MPGNSSNGVGAAESAEGLTEEIVQWLAGYSKEEHAKFKRTRVMATRGTLALDCYGREIGRIVAAHRYANPPPAPEIPIEETYVIIDSTRLGISVALAVDERAGPVAGMVTFFLSEVPYLKEIVEDPEQTKAMLVLKRAMPGSILRESQATRTKSISDSSGDCPASPVTPPSSPIPGDTSQPSA